MKLQSSKKVVIKPGTEWSIKLVFGDFQKMGQILCVKKVPFCKFGHKCFAGVDLSSLYVCML